MNIASARQSIFAGRGASVKRDGERRGRVGGGGSEFVDERTFTMDDHAGRGPAYIAPTSPYADWKPQTFVQHPAYGVGQIVTISGTTPQTRAVIRFPGQGDKTFVLEHAPMIQKLERPAR
ncbi:MAG: hypothetical protein ACKVS9_15365 [Phycisphaerae bacterium]